MKTQVIILLGAMFILSSCSYPLELVGLGTAQPDLIGNDSSSLNSEMESAALKIISQNCSSCHQTGSGPANVHTLTNVNHLISSGLVVPGSPETSQLYTVIKSGRMPSTGALAANDTETIRLWILGGAQAGTGGGGGGGTVPDEPIPDPTPTFSYIQKQILLPNCVGCHNQNNRSGGYAFDTHTNVLKAVNKTSPTRSAIYEVPADGDMPPQPGRRLRTDELGLILAWIEKGAAND